MDTNIHTIRAQNIGLENDNKIVVDYGKKYNHFQYFIKCKKCGKITYAYPHDLECAMKARCRCNNITVLESMIGTEVNGRIITGIIKRIYSEDPRNQLELTCPNCGRTRLASYSAIIKNEITPCVCTKEGRKFPPNSLSAENAVKRRFQRIEMLQNQYINKVYHTKRVMDIIYNIKTTPPKYEMILECMICGRRTRVPTFKFSEDSVPYCTHTGFMPEGVKKEEWDRIIGTWRNVFAKSPNPDKIDPSWYNPNTDDIAQYQCKVNFYNWSMQNGFTMHSKFGQIDKMGPFTPENCVWKPWNGGNRREG